MEKKLQVGQRIDVLEFVWDNQDQINHDVIKTGWQAVGNCSERFPTIMDMNGKMSTSWSDEVIKIGTLIIKSLK